jgi:hypothetical protein
MFTTQPSCQVISSENPPASDSQKHDQKVEGCQQLKIPAAHENDKQCSDRHPSPPEPNRRGYWRKHFRSSLERTMTLE